MCNQFRLSPLPDSSKFRALSEYNSTRLVSSGVVIRTFQDPRISHRINRQSIVTHMLSTSEAAHAASQSCINCHLESDTNTRKCHTSPHPIEIGHMATGSRDVTGAVSNFDCAPRGCVSNCHGIHYTSLARQTSLVTHIMKL